jgi:catechol-2,3-dioxygenase
MKLDLSGIILFVKDVSVVKSFYADTLQLQVAEEIVGEWVLLKTGNCTISLHKMGAAHTGNVRGESNTKIVFDIDTDIDLYRQSLIQQGINMQAVKTFEGYNCFLCDGTDPEGNVFQLRQIKSTIK